MMRLPKPEQPSAAETARGSWWRGANVRTTVVACLLALLLPLGAADRAAPPGELLGDYDVIIAGAGTGGFGAAMQAARLGATVLLLEETDWIGGQMNAASVTSMDEGPLLVRERGIYHEFVERVTAHYEKLGISAETAYGRRHIALEPRVGEDILYAMLAEARAHTKALHVSLLSTVAAVRKAGDTVTGVRIGIASPGAKPEAREIRGRVLIDATEWGDVIPLTGARYRVGNCETGHLDPKLQIQDNTWTATVKQYPRGVPAELLMKAPPPEYEAARARFARSLVAGDEPQLGNVRPWNWGTFIGYRGMPNSEQPANPAITRTHLNFNNDYHTTVADVENPASRLATNRAAILRTLQLLWYIQHELGKSDWSVADDEGFDTPYQRAQMDAWIAERPELAPFREILYRFSIIPYVRESRRIIGLHTLKAREIERRPGRPVHFENAVALGDYAIDLHGSKKPELLELHLDRPEDIPRETFGQKGVGPFAIPFECFIPEKVDGFIPAEKNISQSRLVNGATRLQPSTMLMGQAAGAIAALSAQRGIQPRRLDPLLVQLTLLEAGDTLFITPLKDIGKKSWEWVPAQLAATRGWIPVENGMFKPDEALTGALAARLTKLAPNGENLPDLIGAERPQITRGDLYAVFNDDMRTLHGVRDPHAPLTRLEAARFLMLNFGERARNPSRPFRGWPEPRARTPLSRADANPQLAVTLRVLAQRKLIAPEETEYWLEHAAEGGECDGGRVLELVRKAVALRHPDAAPEALWDLALQERFVGSADYWRKHAVPGGKCSGAFTATILRNLAQKTTPR